MTTLGEAFIPIRATLEKLDQDLEAARSKVTGAFAGVGDVLKGLGGVAVAAIATGLIAVGATAITMATDVQTATAKVQAQLGLGQEAAQGYGDAIQNIYGQNFGADIADVGESLGAVSLQFARLGDVSVATAEAATINAYRLADAYEVDVAESAGAAATLMDEFGLSQQQAFDFMTTGFQRGMNASDDFLDSIGEYGPQFASLGFDAGHFFSIMESGQQGGVLGTDKMADSIKEFGIIITEGGARAETALSAIGLNYDEMADTVSSGQNTWADYFGEIVGGLQDIDDPLQQQQLAVQLFGTMAEDMGAGFLDGLDMMATGLADMEGATAGLDSQYNTLSSSLEGFKRQAQMALVPIGEALLGLATMVLPYVSSALAAVLPVITAIGDVFMGFFNNLNEGMSPLDSFIEAIWQVAPQSVLDALVYLRDDILPALSEAFDNFVQPILDMVAGFVQWQDVAAAVGVVVLAALVPSIWAGVAALGAMMLAALPIIATLAGLIAVVALVRTGWEQNWGGIQEKTATAIAFVQQVVADGVAQVQAWWAENGDAIMAKAAEIWETVSTTISTGIENAKTFISNGLAAIQAWWAENGDEIMAKAAEIWETVSTTVSTGIESAKTFISDGLAKIKGWWAENGDSTMAKVKEIWSNIKGTFKEALALVLGIVSSALLVISGDWDEAKAAWDTVVSDAWEALKGRFQIGIDNLTAIVEKAWPVIKQSFSDGLAAAKEAVAAIDWGAVGKSIVDGIANGLTAAAGAIADAARGAAQLALDAAKDLLGINSPSTVFQHEFAEDGIGEGTVLGLENSASAIADAMAGIMAPLPRIAADYWDDSWMTLDNKAALGDYAMNRKIGQGLAGVMQTDGGGDNSDASLIINVDARGAADPQAVERAAQRGAEAAMATQEWFRYQMKLTSAMG